MSTVEEADKAVEQFSGYVSLYISFLYVVVCW